MTSQPDILFYDGYCGLCHNAVKFVIRQDPTGEAFRFAPLQGDTCRTLISEKELKVLGDTMVVRTADGSLLARSDAWIYILHRLGGGWRTLAASMAVCPRFVRDAVYDWIARIRGRFFRQPADVCPVIPGELRSRFGM